MHNSVRNEYCHWSHWASSKNYFLKNKKNNTSMSSRSCSNRKKELIKIDTCMFYSLCQFNTVNLEGVVHKWRISLRNSFKFTPFPSFLFNIKPHDPFLIFSHTYYPVTSSLPSTCIFLSFKIHIIYEPIKPHPFCNALYKGTFF